MAVRNLCTLLSHICGQAMNQQVLPIMFEKIKRFEIEWARYQILTSHPSCELFLMFVALTLSAVASLLTLTARCLPLAQNGEVIALCHPGKISLGDIRIGIVT